MKRGYGSGKRVVTPDKVQQPPAGPAPGGARLTRAELAIGLRECQCDACPSCNERIGTQAMVGKVAALNASLPKVTRGSITTYGKTIIEARRKAQEAIRDFVPNFYTVSEDCSAVQTTCGDVLAWEVITNWEASSE